MILWHGRASNVSSNNSMDAQPSESSMLGGGGASNYNAEADDDYNDDSLAGTNVESEDEEEDSMIMIQDFFMEDDVMQMNDYNDISLDCLCYRRFDGVDQEAQPSSGAVQGDYGLGAMCMQE
jgi:hypothetical protein